MIFCAPFLAQDLLQFNPAWIDRGLGVEALITTGKSLRHCETRQSIFRNIKHISSLKPSALIIHFPMNDADYIEDGFFKKQLEAIIQLAVDNSADGIVLHSNRVRPRAVWEQSDIARDRRLLYDYVQALQDYTASLPLWIGLENMPLEGNDGDDLDPLLIDPDDFDSLIGGNVGITWDFCHYSYTIASRVKRDSASGLVNLRFSDHFSKFLKLGGSIRHFHFGAFTGFADLRTGDVCNEGVPPWRGSLHERIYSDALIAAASMGGLKTCTLEIKELDYMERTNFEAVLTWCNEVLKGSTE